MPQKNETTMVRQLGIAVTIGLYATVFSYSGSSLRAAEIVRWEALDSAEVHASTITVSSPTKLELQVVNITKGGFSRTAGYAWIVDGKTRDEIWSSEDATGKRVRGNRDLMLVVDTIALSPGTYDLYYFAAVDHGYNTNQNWKGDWNGVFDGIFWNADDIAALAEDCYVYANTVSGNATAGKWTGIIPGSLYSAVRVGDNERIRYGFELLKPMSIRLYTQIELPTGDADPVDNCWITQANSLERVWQANRRTTERGGGSTKNRRFNGEIPLKAGQYILNYTTDDSHSADGFNSQPPYDPHYWGVVLLPGAQFDKSAFKSIEIGTSATPLVDLTRVRDDEYREIPFTLSKESKLLVIAVGEYAGGADEFADYGWITEGRSNRIVWEMQDDNTTHAGGASKNKMFEGVITLPAGSYSLHFATDDSHAYRDWNSAEPSEPAAWGVAIYPPPGQKSIEGLTVADEVRDFGSKKSSKWNRSRSKSTTTINIDPLPPIVVTVPDPPAPPSATNRSRGSVGIGPSASPYKGEVLAAITRVRDDQERQVEFTVKELLAVDIYAIGEGVGEEMADYGWIEDAKNGRIIWEMDYYETRRAGGASKNRMLSTTIELKPGTYRLVYVTDGSHSFRNWNADAPRDEENYGITLYYQKL